MMPTNQTRRPWSSGPCGTDGSPDLRPAAPLPTSRSSATLLEGRSATAWTVKHLSWCLLCWGIKKPNPVRAAAGNTQQTPVDRAESEALLSWCVKVVFWLEHRPAADTLSSADVKIKLCLDDGSQRRSGALSAHFSLVAVWNADEDDDGEDLVWFLRVCRVSSLCDRKVCVFWRVLFILRSGLFSDWSVCPFLLSFSDFGTNKKRDKFLQDSLFLLSSSISPKINRNSIHNVFVIPQESVVKNSTTSQRLLNGINLVSV